MKNSDWNDCLNSYSSIKITPDKEKAKSLIEVSKGRLTFLNNSTPTLEDANSLFEGYSSSLLELLHLIVLLEGYKVSNHVCLGFYLRDIMKNEILFKLFDDCRFKRNSLIYYGKKMDFEVAKESIKLCKKLINSIDKEIKRINN